MKNAAIMLAAILMMGLLLTMSFATAKSINSGPGNVRDKVRTNQKAVSLDDAEDDLEDGNGFDVKKASRDLDASVEREARESTFAQVSIGHGWAISSGGNNTTSEGNFARIFWVEKTFVNKGTNASNQTNQTPANETTKAIGALKIGSDLYRFTLDSQTNDSIVFDVVSEKGKVNGTLELEADLSLAGFTVWSGTLELDSGKSYAIDVATKNSKVKGSAEVRKEIKEEDKELDLKGNLNASERGEGKKLGLFARIRAFFRGE